MEQEGGMIFITLHERDSDKEVSVNINNISVIIGRSIYFGSSTEYLLVKETREEILQLINEVKNESKDKQYR